MFQLFKDGCVTSLLKINVRKCTHYVEECKCVPCLSDKYSYVDAYMYVTGVKMQRLCY